METHFKVATHRLPEFTDQSLSLFIPNLSASRWDRGYPRISRVETLAYQTGCLVSCRFNVTSRPPSNSPAKDFDELEMNPFFAVARQ